MTFLPLIAILIALPVFAQIDAMVAMRDGVRLSTRIWPLKKGQRAPVALFRTPYGKPRILNPSLRVLLDSGFIVAVQDVRGRSASEGRFKQFVQEEADGADTIAWLARQGFCDGKVVMFGGSYSGMAQWRAALANPPALKAISPAVAGGDEYLDRFYSPGGAFRLGHRLLWMADNLRIPGFSRPSFRSLTEYLPLANSDRVATGATLDFYQTVIDHPSYDDYWRQLSTIRRIQDVKVPVHITAGWFDSYAPSDIEMFQALRRLNRPARLLVGPWGHNTAVPAGSPDYGAAARVSPRKLEADWLASTIRGHSPVTGVRYFVTGRNEWLDSPVWPPDSVQERRFYLGSRGDARSLSGNGSLDHRPPPVDGHDEFLYDPADPVPTRGGATCCNPRVFPWGPLPQNSVERRYDVLVYTTPPIVEPVEIAGSVTAVIYVSTSAFDSDFTAKLVDVAPDGTARIVCDGILRLRYREGLEKPSPYEPNSVEKVVVGAGVAAHRFASGHRIRLDISSSNFPKFDRNLNSVGPVARSAVWKSALQRVWHGGNTSSYLGLPVVRETPVAAPRKRPVP